MTMSWPAFVAALAAAFVALNFVFAVIYDLGEAPIANAREGSLADLFFFSVETTSTVGYGDMHPQTIYGHVVATAENFIGLLLLAVMTGLVFARFSRPRARIIFAKYPVVTKHNGVTTLIFRMANARSNFITEATAKLWVLSPTVTEEGRRLIGFEQMRLMRSENPTFALSWTLFHPIDEQSPLFGQDEETLADEPDQLRRQHRRIRRDVRADRACARRLRRPGRALRPRVRGLRLGRRPGPAPHRLCEDRRDPTGFAQGRERGRRVCVEPLKWSRRRGLARIRKMSGGDPALP